MFENRAFIYTVFMQPVKSNVQNAECNTILAFTAARNVEGINLFYHHNHLLGL